MEHRDPKQHKTDYYFKPILTYNIKHFKEKQKQTQGIYIKFLQCIIGKTGWDTI
jgi:hypothetical protein